MQNIRNIRIYPNQSQKGASRVRALFETASKIAGNGANLVGFGSDRTHPTDRATVTKGANQ